MKRSHDSDHDDAGTDNSSSSSEEKKPTAGKGENENRLGAVDELQTMAASTLSHQEQLRRELNRRSKSRCRKRKVDKIEKLQSEFARLSQEFNALQAENEHLRQEFLDALNAAGLAQASLLGNMPTTPSNQNQMMATPVHHHQTLQSLLQRDNAFLASSYPSAAHYSSRQERTTGPLGVVGGGSLNHQQILQLLQNIPTVATAPNATTPAHWNHTPDQRSVASQQPQLSPYVALLAALQSVVERANAANRF